jgi:ATP synthase F1 complex assembly factor 2
LKPWSFPLTSLLTRSLDCFSCTETREETLQKLLKYLHTDSILYQQSYPDSLVKLQEKHWKPIIDWVSSLTPMRVTDGFQAIQQPAETISYFENWIKSLDDLELAACERACLTSKSVLIAFALMHGKISVQEASDAARVEVTHQINRWGMVEDSHDTDCEEITRQLGCCAMVLLGKRLNEDLIL